MGRSPSTDEIDAQLDLRRRHPFSRLNLWKNGIQSRLAQVELQGELDVAYGTSAGQTLDVFLPPRSDGAPVFVFFHGGYFRSLDKRQYRYVARPLVRSGFAVVLVNYDLVPHVSVAEIVRQAKASFAWVRERARDWGGDPRHVVLCGHSVGAFLVARLLEGAEPGAGGVERALLLSGVYDLVPLQRSYLNEDLRLSAAEAAELNPSADAIRAAPRILVAVGGDETGEFLAQSRDYSEQLARAGISHEHRVLPGINHYTMSRLLARRNTSLLDWIVASP